MFVATGAKKPELAPFLFLTYFWQMVDPLRKCSAETEGKKQKQTNKQTNSRTTKTTTNKRINKQLHNENNYKQTNKQTGTIMKKQQHEHGQYLLIRNFAKLTPST